MTKEEMRIPKLIIDATEWLEELKDFEEIELENVKIDVKNGIIEFSAPVLLPQILKEEERRVEIKIPEYKPFVQEWKNRIEEVQLGATKEEGGTRKKVFRIGGENGMPFYPGCEMKNRPLVTFDVFDMPPPLPKAIRDHFEDVMEDPVAWAKRGLELGANLVTIHLVSTDPRTMDRKPEEAAETVRELLENVDVPLVIGGSGNPQKDPLVLEACAKTAKGERCLLASATLDIDYERIARAAIENNHVVLAWTSIDINQQKELNRKLLNLGLRRDQLVMDPTTAVLGYGIEYTISVMQRMRLEGLKGDKEISFPMSSGTTNAWGAREAWMKREDWGDRMLRGPLWETITGVTMLLCGVDLFMMLHPRSVQTLQNVIDQLSRIAEKGVEYENWITM